MKNEMGGACSAMGERRAHTWFWCGKLKEGDHVNVLGVEEKIILKWTLQR